MLLQLKFHFQDNLTDNDSDPEDPDLHRPGDGDLPRSQHPQVHGGGGEPGRERDIRHGPHRDKGQPHIRVLVHGVPHLASNYDHR